MSLFVNTVLRMNERNQIDGFLFAVKDLSLGDRIA